MSESVEVVRQKEIVTRMRELNTKVIAERDALAAEFKNFHRLLCERFCYPHDPVDWKRDQLSLIEHIARDYDGDCASPSETTVQPSPDGTQMGVWRQGYPSLDDPPETEAKDG